MNGRSRNSVTTRHNSIASLIKPLTRSSRSEVELELHIRVQNPIAGLLIVRVDVGEPADTTAWDSFEIRTF